jgi:hypothetical protein
LELIPEPLIDYRQHRGQLIGVGLFAQIKGNTETNSTGIFGPDMALKRVETFEQRITQFRGSWIRPDVLKVIAGRRAYLERRQAMEGRNWPVRMRGLVRNLVSGDYVRYGTFPKRELLSDLRGS